MTIPGLAGCRKYGLWSASRVGYCWMNVRQIVFRWSGFPVHRTDRPDTAPRFGCNFLFLSLLQDLCQKDAEKGLFGEQTCTR